MLCGKRENPWFSLVSRVVFASAADHRISLETPAQRTEDLALSSSALGRSSMF